MGYVIKKGAAGGGDATAANQKTQINQIVDGTFAQNVLKDNFGESVLKDNNEIGVFKDNTGNSLLKDSKTNSVFLDASNNSIINNSNIINNTILAVGFAGSSPAALSSALNSYFLSNIGYYIISITYADAGGVGTNPHSAIVVLQQSA